MVNYLPTLEARKSGILCLIWKAQFYNTVTACSHQVQEQNSCVTALYLSSYVPDIVLDFPKQYFVITERNINLSFYEDFIKLSNIDKYNTVNRRKKRKWQPQTHSGGAVDECCTPNQSLPPLPLLKILLSQDTVSFSVNEYLQCSIWHLTTEIVRPLRFGNILI